MKKKIKRELIPCPVDTDCRNWDMYNETCQDNGCRASGFRKITKEDVHFYTLRRKMEIDLRNTVVKNKNNQIRSYE